MVGRVVVALCVCAGLVLAPEPRRARPCSASFRRGGGWDSRPRVPVRGGSCGLLRDVWRTLRQKGGAGPRRRPRATAYSGDTVQPAVGDSSDPSHGGTGAGPGSGSSQSASDGLEQLTASHDERPGISQGDAAAPNDEVALLRQVNLLARESRADSDADGVNQEDADDSWLADFADDEGPHARSVPLRSGAEGPDRPFAASAGAPLPLRQFAGARSCSDSEENVGEDGGESEGEESEGEDSEDWDLPMRGETWSESEDSALLLSPVSRFKHKLQKLRWKWYDEEERKPDAAGWTELDRQLRRNVDAALVCRPPMLLALGGSVSDLLSLHAFKHARSVQSASTRTRASKTGRRKQETRARHESVDDSSSSTRHYAARNERDRAPISALHNDERFNSGAGWLQVHRAANGICRVESLRAPPPRPGFRWHRPFR